MKNKLFKIITILISLAFLSGCTRNKNTLTCSVIENSDGIKKESTLVIKKQDNQIKDMTLTLNVTIPASQIDYRQNLMQQMRQKTNKVYANSDGIKAIFDMNSTYFEALGINTTATLSEVKQVLELQGYTCQK